MAAWILLLVLVATALRAQRSGRSMDDRAQSRWLLLLALSVPVQAVCLGMARSSARAGAAPILVALAAGLGLLTWISILHLVAWGTRRRDLFVRLPLLAFAGVGLLAGSSAGAATFAVLGTVSYRWKERIPTVRRLQLGLGALALAIVALRFSPDVDTDALTGATRVLAVFALASATLAGVHALLGAFALFGAFVRDPSLGIRRVSRRLALSHLLVAGVPLALVILLWIFTTVLGVSQERAAIGARALESDADRLVRSLAAAANGPEPREALRRMAAVRAPEWPALRVWWREGRTLERLAGGAVELEGALALWMDSLASLPRAGVVALGDSFYMGAAARSAGDAGGAVSLAPLPVALGTAAGIVHSPLELVVEGTRGLVRVDPDSAAPLARSDPVPADREESLAVERVRAVTRRLGLPDTVVQADGRRARARIVTGGDTLHTGSGGVLQGLVLVDGLRYGPGGWRPARFLLTSRTPAGELLAGLYRRARESEPGLVPLTLLALAAALFLAIAIWDLVMVTNMGRSITGAIGALRTAAARLEAGDLAHRIEVKGRDELWSVADAFNTAAAGLEVARERERERQRIDSELMVARRIQSRLLPEVPPQVAGLEIAGHYDPAREVGGDYFDHLPAGEGRVLLVIADVSGKSVPASLIMSAFRAALHAQSLSVIEPGDLAERLNRFLHQSLDPGKFVTAFLGLLEGETGRLCYVNAGHNPPVLLRRDGSYELLEKGGTILGILPASRYEQGEAALAPGDLLALYTDGVTEGSNEEGEPWGERRLIERLRAGSGRPCAEVAAAIAAAVRGFEGEQGATDDVTLLLARRRS